MLVLLILLSHGEAIPFVESEKLEKYNYSRYKVKSFRNMIAQEFYNIKLPAVWQKIENDLQQLKEIIQSILKNEFE